MIEVQRTDFVGIPVTYRAEGVKFKDPFGNSLILHHRHAPYRDGSKP